MIYIVQYISCIMLVKLTINDTCRTYTPNRREYNDASPLTTAGRASLIKFATTSQAIYPFTALPPPKGIMKAILKLERAFLWTASDKVFRW
jgi:hypothetical protein